MPLNLIMVDNELRIEGFEQEILLWWMAEDDFGTCDMLDSNIDYYRLSCALYDTYQTVDFPKEEIHLNGEVIGRFESFHFIPMGKFADKALLGKQELAKRNEQIELENAEKSVWSSSA